MLQEATAAPEGGALLSSPLFGHYLEQVLDPYVCSSIPEDVLFLTPPLRSMNPSVPQIHAALRGSVTQCRQGNVTLAKRRAEPFKEKKNLCLLSATA